MIVMSSFNKLFICEIKGISNGENASYGVTKSIMKSSVLGVVTGIQKFSRKTVYSVDDGTGTLDCVLWHHESASVKQINKLRMELNSGNAIMDKEMNTTCHLFLNKIEINEEDADYNHGDSICCLGVVKVVKGRLLLDINHHYKVHNVNGETLWILDVLSCHQRK